MFLTMFSKAVLEATRKVPCGRITTYGEIAKVIGRPKAARAVGNALNKNPYAPVVPCHRVAKGGGGIGGFNKGAAQKIKILKKEGLIIKNNRIVDFNKFFYHF
jgi:O-6-methylguanine DNA methyltransferase